MTFIQAVDYKKQNPKLSLIEFIDYAETQISSKEVKTLLEMEKKYFESLKV